MDEKSPREYVSELLQTIAEKDAEIERLRVLLGKVAEASLICSTDRHFRKAVEKIMEDVTEE